MSDQPPNPSSVVSLVPKTDNEIEKMRAATTQGMRGLAAWSELMVLVARQRRAAFNAYRAEGFTDAQAIELCKTV